MGLFDFLFKKKKKAVAEPVKEESARAEKEVDKAPVDEVKAPEAKADDTPEVKESEAFEDKDAPEIVKKEKKAKSPRKNSVNFESDEGGVEPADAKEAEPKEPKTKKTTTKTKAEPVPVVEEPDASDDFDFEGAEDSKPEQTRTARTGKFEIKKTKDDRYVFNLYASNHVIVATSQIYSSVQSAMTGIKSIIANAERSPIEDTTLKTYETLSFPKWEIYLDNGGQYRFRLYATNGSCVVHSQGYTVKTNCKKGIESIIKTARDAEISKKYLKKHEK